MTVLYHEYLPILIFIGFSTALSAIIFGLSYVLIPQKGDLEKTSPYECGFDPYGDSRSSFDIRFYLVAILFIIFDIEAAFIFPWAVSLGEINYLGFWTMIDFLVELILGYVYAWKIGALEWE